MASSQSFQKCQVPVKCNLCENETIKWKCEDCGLLLCTNCRDKKHSKIKNSQNHKIIDIKQIGAHSDQVELLNIKCTEHFGQMCCRFCTICDSLVCPICISKIHKGHNLIEISEGFNMKIDKLERGQIKIQTNVAKLATKKELLEQCKSQENEKYREVMENIQSHGNSLKQTVDKHIEGLKHEVSEYQKTTMHSIDTDLDVILNSMKQVEDKNNKIDDFIKTTDIAKFFHEVVQLENSLYIPIPRTKSLYNSIPKFVPGKITQSNVGVLQNEVSPVKLGVALQVISEYQTELSIVTDIIPCSDGSIWMNCDSDEKLVKVKPEGNNLNILSSFNINIYGMAILPSNDILLCIEGESTLKQLNNITGELTDTVYNVNPFVCTAIHITSGNKVVVGGNDDELGRTAVFVMNDNGDHETVYEHDQHNQPILTYPQSITSTNNGNIHVADSEKASDQGRVVVLGQGGDIVNIYTGHTDINRDIPFTPVRIVTTPRDNVIVVDVGTQVFHILNNTGQLFFHYDTKIMKRIHPYCLAFTPTGQLFIGCSKSSKGQENESRLYQVTISGC